MSFYYPIFGCFLIFVVWLTYELKKSDRLKKESEDKFWENESQANTTRKVFEENIPFLTIPLEQFPIGKFEEDEFKEYDEKLLALSKKKLLNMTGKTSTNIKEMFGPANLELISTADENFTELIKLLSNYAALLSDRGYSVEAQTVLEYAVSIGSDIVSTYVLLATIYKETGHTDKISDLIDTASTLDSLLKNKIRTSLKTIQES